jgi:hypothetical protein
MMEGAAPSLGARGRVTLFDGRLDDEFAAATRSDEAVRRVATIPGIGPVKCDRGRRCACILREHKTCRPGSALF